MKLANFYEVKDQDNNSAFGSESAIETVRFYRTLPNAKIVVTIWDVEDSEEMRLVTDQIDVTSLVIATILDQMERGKTQ
jgi:hypothetical protein